VLPVTAQNPNVSNAISFKVRNDFSNISFFLSIKR